MYIVLIGRGLAALLILDTGAMRRPEHRDGQEVRISHAFFVSKNQVIIGRRGEIV